MREVGVAHADAGDVYFGLSTGMSFPILCTQQSYLSQDTPSEVYDNVASLRDYGERRKIVVILQGDASWMRNYRSQLTGPGEPDAIVYCAAESELSSLGVRPVDAGWTPGSPGVDIERHIGTRREARPKITPSAEWGGYFSQPKPALDPRLFDGDKLKREIRDFCLNTLYNFWDPKYTGARDWSKLWIAGSAACYQYSESNADLDILIGVDLQTFQLMNPTFGGKTEAEMVAHWNHEFDTELEATTTDFLGFHVTFFVNPGSWDIRVMNPYAAYSLTFDEWTVPPVQVPVPWDPFVYFGPEEVSRVYAIYDKCVDIVERYNFAKDRGDDARRIAVTGEAAALFAELYAARQQAYSPGGKGYYDPKNFQWQVLEGEGALKAIHEIKNFGLNPTEQKSWSEDLSPDKLPFTMDPRRRKPLPTKPELVVKSMTMSSVLAGPRPGGDKRGNAESRRRRKHWMLATWGDGTSCPCVHCGDTVTFETVEADRIIPGESYRRSNVQPSCKPCNQSRSNKLDWVPPNQRDEELLVAAGREAGRDTPAEEFGLIYDPLLELDAEVSWARELDDWDSVPVVEIDLSERLWATEEMLDSRPISRVLQGEPLREGYDPQVLRKSDGRLVVIDGHHRAAMHTAMGHDSMRVHLVDMTQGGWDWVDAGDGVEARKG